MGLQIAAALCLALSASIVLGDFLGPTYPAPLDLTSDSSLVRAAWEDVSATFDAYLKQGKNTSATADLNGADKVTFSAGLFSLHDAAATQLQYHYTAPQVAHSKQGTNRVDADSIYRIASVSKLITVFTGMLNLSPKDWNSPITDFLPELAAFAAKYSGESDPISYTQWDKITPWVLATQQAGITSVGYINDLLLQYTAKAILTNTSVDSLETAVGLPPLEISTSAPCADFGCTAEEFITANQDYPPVFLPWTTPAYSDLGMMFLGLSISNVTGKEFPALYSGSVFEPLGMTSSFVNAPTSGPELDRSVVAGPLANNWAFPTNNPTIPSGGIVSTLNDLDKLGIGLLNSTLLPSERTREWMKPHTHTASYSYSIGAPFEIYRYQSPTTGKLTDIYTKLGDSGTYGAMVALIPDYDAGFSFLNAFYAAPPSTFNRGQVALTLINHIAEAILPALEAQAAAEARKNFVGTYTSTDAKVNSSLTIAFNQSNIITSKDGLNIERWISNSTDALTAQYATVKPRLLPAIPRQSEGSGQLSLQAAINPQWNSYTAAGLGPFTGFYDSNFDWAVYDGSRYGGKGIDSFVFDVDAEGYATAVTNAATALKLQRQKTS